MNSCAKDSNRKSFTRQVSRHHLSQAPSLMIVTIGICGEHVEAMLTTGQNEHDFSFSLPLTSACYFEHD